MNGAVEEGAKVAGGIVEGLKSQPLSLALIVMNLIFVGFAWLILDQLNTRTTRQYEVKDQLIARLIDKCRDPQSTQQ